MLLSELPLLVSGIEGVLDCNATFASTVIRWDNRVVPSLPYRTSSRNNIILFWLPFFFWSSSLFFPGKRVLLLREYDMTTNCRFVSTVFEHSCFFSRAVNVIILCIYGGTLVNTCCDDLWVPLHIYNLQPSFWSFSLCNGAVALLLRPFWCLKWS